MLPLFTSYHQLNLNIYLLVNKKTGGGTRKIDVNKTTHGRKPHVRLRVDRNRFPRHIKGIIYEVLLKTLKVVQNKKDYNTTLAL